MNGIMADTVRGPHRVEQIMGMPIGIDVRDVDIDPVVLDRVFDWFRWVDATFSTHKPESEISRLNTGALTLTEAHPDVRSILERCEQLRFETDGYFDIRTDHLPIPVKRTTGLTTSTGIDPSGLVKGWSVDRAADILGLAGARNYSINAGGDVLVRGGALPELGWRVGIRHPLLRNQVAAVVAASYLAIATSGTYERGQHIVDPTTGATPQGVLSVTIVGPDLATADAYATAAFAMGVSGVTWAALLPGYEAMIILEDERVLSTSGFPSLDPDDGEA